jgi:hypothetical protein
MPYGKCGEARAGKSRRSGGVESRYSSDLPSGARLSAGSGLPLVVEPDRVQQKGALHLLPIRRFDPVGDLKARENDPNCALCDCRAGLGPLGLRKPL